MRKYLVALIALTSIGQPAAGSAREVSITGGISTGFEYYDRQDKELATVDSNTAGTTTSSQDQEKNDYQRIVVRPLLTVSTASEKDSVDLRYEPGFHHDFLHDEQDAEQNISLSAQRQLTKTWLIQLVERYLKTDAANQARDEVASSTSSTAKTSGESTNDQPGQDQLASDTRRRKYSTNNLQVVSAYEYAQDSVVSAGYTFGVLRNYNNEDLRYQDFDKHDSQLSLTYRVNSTWKMSLAGHYIRGIYDTSTTAQDDTGNAASSAGSAAVGEGQDDLSQDVTEYRSTFGQEFSLTPRQLLSLDYNRVAYDYDAKSKSDSEIHDLTFGWRWEYSPHFTFNAGAGPSFVVTDEVEDSWGYNGNLNGKYTFEHGNLQLAVKKGLERQNFTGDVANDGLVDFWDVRADISYNLLSSASVSLFTGYHSEDQDETRQNAAESTSSGSSDQTTEDIATLTTRRFSAGCSARYSFWQWYAIDLSYRYTDQISDRAEDEYYEHLVMLTMSFAKEFFRW
jgi:hypothetical protein